ncbi:MAG: sigma 54-interacting transcriptional regulator [Acidobacteriota bacterium]
MSPDLATLLATSPALRRQLVGIEKVAGVLAPVLLLGEAGSGRSTLARALHRAGGRPQGPLVEVDCGAIPPDLFDSELFGYRAGAFTGAVSDSPGRLGRAAGGTLVLDRVESLPQSVQPKLLRVVAEGVFSRLGGEEQAADVRFVAIGGSDLPRRVEGGAFRSDLYYRLAVVSYEVPPLRDRRDEIPHLAEALLADLAIRLGRSPDIDLDRQALSWMTGHPWPGNLTELRNVLERSLVVNTSGSVLAPEAPASARPRSLAEVEKEEILRALAHTRGHQGRAAEMLGISRKALWEKRRRHGIP